LKSPGWKTDVGGGRIKIKGFRKVFENTRYIGELRQRWVEIKKYLIRWATG
jgi:hypothetical protein